MLLLFMLQIYCILFQTLHITHFRVHGFILCILYAPDSADAVFTDSIGKVFNNTAHVSLQQ